MLINVKLNSLKPLLLVIFGEYLINYSHPVNWVSRQKLTMADPVYKALVILTPKTSSTPFTLLTPFLTPTKMQP